MISSDIKKLLDDVYVKIQQKITNVSIGSVTSSIFYALSVLGESIYGEIEEVKTQSTVATSTGNNLDRVINGTYPVTRGLPTRSSGYTVLYADNPILNTANIVLTCAKFNQDGTLSNTDNATRFTGKLEEGNADKVYVLVEPDNQAFVKTVGLERVIDFKSRQPQFLILPIVSLNTGEVQNLGEGDVAVFPNTPLGLSGSENIYNIYERFSFSSQQANEPLQSRFTTFSSFDGISFLGINGFFFTKVDGVIEFYSRDRKTNLSAIYRNGLSTVTRPFRLEYTLATNNTLVLTSTLLSGVGTAPSIKVEDVSGNLVTYYLESLVWGTFAYQISKVALTNVLTPTGGGFFTVQDIISTILAFPEGINLQEVFKEILAEYIFDPDKQFTFSTGQLLDTAVLSGGADTESDDSYKLSLQKYLSSLGKATPRALESAAFSTDGINFAKVLNNSASPLGSATMVISNSSLGVSKNTINQLYSKIDYEDKAAGINAIIKTPIPTYLLFSLDISISANVDKQTTYNSIYSTVNTYLGDKLPGERIKYSDIIAEINSLTGVENIKSLIVNKELSSPFFVAKKLYQTNFFPYFTSVGGFAYSGYHAAVIAVAWGSRLAHSPSSGYIVGQPLIPEANISNLIAPSYATSLTDPIWDALMVDLYNANTLDKYKTFLRLNYDIVFGGFSNEFDAFNQYCLLLGEPIEPGVGNLQSVPLSIERAIAANLVDYPTKEFEITDVSAELVKTEFKPMFGVRFFNV